jgi:hypothetical protein
MTGDEPVELTGGNMNTPILKQGLVYKEATPATDNIHALLCHLRRQGITWIPESFGVDGKSGRHALSFIPGEVPHENPDWLREETIMTGMGQKLRAWHDASIGFRPVNEHWLLSTDEGTEVICHNDFAPYNWVFRDRRFAGLIDFDTCSPGSRLWDIAYTAYRLVPLVPAENVNWMISRLELFLEAYAGGDRKYRYAVSDVIRKLVKRMLHLADWSRKHGEETGNSEIIEHAAMYGEHALWAKGLEYDR